MSLQQECWEIAQAARKGIDQEVYGGHHGSSDSNALTEVWPVSIEGAFAFLVGTSSQAAYKDGFAVIVAPHEVVAHLTKPDYPEKSP